MVLKKGHSSALAISKLLVEHMQLVVIHSEQFSSPSLPAHAMPSCPRQLP